MSTFYETQSAYLQREASKRRTMGCFDSANELAEQALQTSRGRLTYRSRGIELTEHERYQLSRWDCFAWDRFADAGQRPPWPRPFGPSRDGSTRCRSGSIASGGANTYCTCDTCF